MTPGGNDRRDTFFPELLAPLQALEVQGRIRVALSGGLDSTVLLHLAQQASASHSAELSAIHVNHQLQPDADRFETFCRSTCEELRIPLEVVRVAVGVPADGSAGSVEAAAREARYRAFEERLATGDVLLMAHHGDDQAETLLFRLCRGTGIRGLAGIPRRRRLGAGQLLRPLLGFSRQMLEAQARAAGVPWLDDPTNADDHHDRNFLRHRILPQLKQRWPGLDRRLAATARACGEADQLADALAREQFSRLGGDEGRLDLDGVRALARAEQRNLLRWWLGVDLNRTLTDRELMDLLYAESDRAPEIRGGRFALRRFHGHIYRIDCNAESVITEARLVPGQPVRCGGFRIELMRQGDPRLSEPDLMIRGRQGGERIRPTPGGPSKPLKKWLQEQLVPPWERARLPLIHEGDELVAVGTLWCASLYRPGPSGTSSGAGWRIEVRRDFD